MAVLWYLQEHLRLAWLDLLCTALTAGDAYPEAEVTGDGLTCGPHLRWELGDALPVMQKE